MWWIEPWEIGGPAGELTGRFRLTAYSDEDGGGPHALCDCPGGHDSAEEAKNCEEARSAAEGFLGVPMKTVLPPVEEAKKTVKAIHAIANNMLDQLQSLVCSIPDPKSGTCPNVECWVQDERMQLMSEVAHLENCGEGLVCVLRDLLEARDPAGTRIQDVVDAELAKRCDAAIKKWQESR